MATSDKNPNAGFYQRDRAWHPPGLAPAYKSSVLRSPQQNLLSMDATISEITGPRFGHEVIGEFDNNMIINYPGEGGEALGERLLVHGRILDENGKGVPECLLEFWQANAAGRYRHNNDNYRAPLDANFGGCGRTISDDNGNYSFYTIKPGPYPWPNGPNDWRPAHIHFSLFGHAFAQRLITQMYFEGDPLIGRCPIVGSITSKKAIASLTALLDMDKATPFDMLAYKFDIVLRGHQDTFFEE